MPPDEVLCSLGHGKMIKRLANMPDQPAPKRRGDAAGHDPVAIGPANGIKAGAEIIINPARRQHSHRIRQMRVERKRQAVRVKRIRQIKMGRLPGGVNPGIGAASPLNRNRHPVANDG